jgi:hypothetical protein
MDYLEDIIVHSSTDEDVSPLRPPPKKMRPSTTPTSTPEKEFADDGEEESKSASEGKGTNNMSILLEALKKKIEDDKQAKEARIDALLAQLKPPKPKKCKYCENAPCIIN